MKSKNYYIALVLKHLEGELSSDKEQELQNWIYQDVKNEQLYEKIKLNWQEESPDIPVYDWQAAFQKVSDKLSFPAEKPSLSSNVKKLNFPKFKQWQKIAAIVIGILVISEFAYLGLFNTVTTYTTGSDQIATVLLPDHSLVTLYENSSITYKEEWQDEKIREVSLEGAAFFDVTKDKSKPFFVNTSDIAIKVLGTSFNVEAYDDHEFVETTLVEGSVEINKLIDSDDLSGDKLTLLPSQKALFSKKTGSLTLLKADIEDFKSLKNEDFVFSNERVGEIIKIISKKFKVSIKAENERLNKCTVTADFSGQSLEITLGLLCRLIDARYTIDDDEIMIIGTGCN